MLVCFAAREAKTAADPLARFPRFNLWCCIVAPVKCGPGRSRVWLGDKKLGCAKYHREIPAGSGVAKPQIRSHLILENTTSKTSAINYDGQSGEDSDKYAVCACEHRGSPAAASAEIVVANCPSDHHPQHRPIAQPQTLGEVRCRLGGRRSAPRLWTPLSSACAWRSPLTAPDWFNRCRIAEALKSDDVDSGCRRRNRARGHVPTLEIGPERWMLGSLALLARRCARIFFSLKLS